MTSTFDHDTQVLPRTGDGGAPRRWWNRTTLALFGVALLVGGFLGGVHAEQRRGTAPAPAAGAAGTVKHVDGNTLYLETETGATVTVRTNDSTTVNLTQPAALSRLLPGQEVVVQGIADAEGIVTATSLTAG